MQLLRRKSSTVLPPFRFYLLFPVFLLSPFFSLPTYRLHLHSAVLRLSLGFLSLLFVDETALPMADNISGANPTTGQWVDCCLQMLHVNARTRVNWICCSDLFSRMNCELSKTLIFKVRRHKHENKVTADHKNLHNTDNSKWKKNILIQLWTQFGKEN